MDNDWSEEDQILDELTKVNYNILNSYYSHKNYKKDLEYLRKLRRLLIQLIPKRTDKNF